ncbi:splicing factor 3A subunit 2-like [Anopheles funestus]|uniref:splicing factor 3A subunit 2-like n=1 Tax=Anopheles funestus TaxID=62324 RepID=UPI0020C61E8D|nr:splicing factor 3A subunit 2-like [Anopheles funestus]
MAKTTRQPYEAPCVIQPEKSRIEPKKFVKIGRAGYRVTKQRDPENDQQSLLFQIGYPEITDGIVPRHWFMFVYHQSNTRTRASANFHNGT